MRGTIVTLTALLALRALPGPAQPPQPPADAPKPECTCAAAFDQVVAGIEESYAGFPIKVDARRRPLLWWLHGSLFPHTWQHAREL